MLLCKSPGLGASGPSCVGLAKLAKLPGKSLWLAQFDLPTHSGERDRQSPSVPTKVSVTTGPRGTLSTAPTIWNLVDWNGSRRKVSFLQILQSLGEGSKPQRRERECSTEGATAEPQLSSSPWLTSPINLCLFLGAEPSTRAYGAGTGLVVNPSEHTSQIPPAVVTCRP